MAEKFNWHQVDRNIPLLGLIKISKWFMLYMPIVKLFLEDNHLSDRHLFILHGIYSLTTAIMEIPSGYLADIWGRKNALILGTIFGVFGFLLFSVSHGLLYFVIAEIILGFSGSMISGADSAMLYDTLTDQKRSNTFLKFDGKITAYGNFSEAISAVFGGLLAVQNVRFPYIGQTIIALMGVIAAFLLIKPTSHKLIINKSFNQLLKIIKTTIIDNKELRYNILLSSVIGTATLSMAWFVQIFYTDLHIPVASMGIIWALLNFIPGITSFFAFRIERYLSVKSSIWIIVSGIVLGFIILGWFKSYWGFAIIAFFYLIRGYATPVLKNYINAIADSSSRATILSIRSLVIRSLFSIMGPFFGYMKDVISLQTALQLAGLIILIMAIPTSILFLKFHQKGEIKHDPIQR